MSKKKTSKNERPLKKAGDGGRGAVEMEEYLVNLTGSLLVTGVKTQLIPEYNGKNVDHDSLVAKGHKNVTIDVIGRQRQPNEQAPLGVKGPITPGPPPKRFWIPFTCLTEEAEHLVLALAASTGACEITPKPAMASSGDAEARVPQGSALELPGQPSLVNPS